LGPQTIRIHIRDIETVRQAVAAEAARVEARKAAEPPLYTAEAAAFVRSLRADQRLAAQQARRAKTAPPRPVKPKVKIKLTQRDRDKAVVLAVRRLGLIR
jgi:hypothetical protein